jgi:glutathionyl-hydroquinone reductase
MSQAAQADISNFKNKDDGQFRRGQSTFRNFIEKDGRFPPEKGLSVYSPTAPYGCVEIA